MEGLIQSGINKIKKYAQSVFQQAPQALQSYSNAYQKISPYIPFAPKVSSPQQIQQNYQSVVKPVSNFYQKQVASPTGFLNPENNFRALAPVEYQLNPNEWNKLQPRQKIGTTALNVMNALAPMTFGSPTPKIGFNPKGAAIGYGTGAGLEALSQEKPTLKSTLLSPNAVLGGALGGIIAPEGKLKTNNKMKPLTTIKESDMFVQNMKTGELLKVPSQLKNKFKVLDNEGLAIGKDWHVTSGLSSTKIERGGLKIVGNADESIFNSLKSKIQYEKPPIQTPIIKAKVVNGKVKISDKIPEIMQPKIEVDPVQKIVTALNEVSPLRGKQEALYTGERAARISNVAEIGKNIPGEAGFRAQLGALKGEMPKVTYESIRKQLTQTDIDSLFSKVESTEGINQFDKITAKTGLAKLLGEKGTALPTRGELDILNQIFPKEFTQSILNKRPLMEKVFSNTVDALNIPRSVMATADLSAPGRQGVFLIGSKEYWKAFGSQIKYALDPKAYEGLQQEIVSRPTYPLMKENGLALTNLGGNLLKREESFMSTLAEKIPVFGTVNKASNRAYSGFLNKLRADTFDRLIKGASETGVNTTEIAGDVAKFVNYATGRGDLKSLNRIAPIINGAFFSPRLMASRLNLLNPMFYAKLDPFVRKEALKSLITFAGTGMTVLGLAKAAGAEVGTDPRSADFGKMKFGNTRYDVFGGFTQYIRLAAQLITGKLISTTTGKEYTLGEGYKPLTRTDILVRFMENKESPIASFVTSLMRGQNSMGEKLNLPVEIVNRFIPMVVQDIYDITKDKGSLAQGALMGIPGIFGIGSQTYGKQVPNIETTAAGNPSIKLKPVGGIAEDIVNKLTNTPESNIPVEQQQGLVSQIQANKQQIVDKDKLKQQLEAGQTPQVNATDFETAKLMFKYSPDTVKKVGDVVLYKDGETIKKIELSKNPQLPELTGQAELDKKLISTYTSELSSKISDIATLYKLGQISAEEANAMIYKIKQTQNSVKVSSGKTGKKGTIKKVSAGKVPKLKAIKSAKVKAIKIPKIKTLTRKKYKVAKAPKIKVKTPKFG